jgi:hypothetical protein
LTLTPVGGGTMLVGSIAPITTEGPLPSSGPRLGAFAQFSDGTGMYVSATWTSSDETVILIADNAFRARQTGTVTITATFNGRSDSETFQVQPGVPGLWAGTYVVQQCQANSSAMLDVLCSETGNGGRGGAFRIGSTLPITMDISQPGIGPEITGTVSLGQARGTLNGMNRGAGLFSLAGDLAATGTLVSITHWDARAQQDAMEGFINFRVQFNAVTGIGEVATRLTGVTRQ